MAERSATLCVGFVVPIRSLVQCGRGQCSVQDHEKRVVWTWGTTALGMGSGASWTVQGGCGGLNEPDLWAKAPEACVIFWVVFGIADGGRRDRLVQNPPRAPRIQRPSPATCRTTQNMIHLQVLCGTWRSRRVSF